MADLYTYLAEGEVIHEFRLKAACELSDEQIDKMETHLRKYEAFDISSPKRTILQSAPLDFYDHAPSEIYIIDFKTKLAMSPAYALAELVGKMGVAERDLRLMNVKEPREIENEIRMNATEKEKTALLSDDEYSEADDIDAADYHGEKHLTKFMKELQASKRKVPTEIKESALKEGAFSDIDTTIQEAYIKLEEASELMGTRMVTSALQSQAGIDANDLTKFYDSLGTAADILSDIMAQLGNE